MSNIKQLLEKANRKCEMRWRVFAFDPAKDNELVHTSKDAFDCIKMAGEYKMDLAKKHPDYIIEVIAESKEQRNEADKIFLKKIEDVLHRYNLPSAKIVDERKVDNTHYIYKIDVNLTDYAKSLQKDAIDFDKVKKDNALKALSFLTIDGIYPQRNSQSILMQVNFHKGKPESAQKNEAKPSKADLEKAAYSSSFMNRRANVTIDGKTYVKIGKDKWEYHPSQSSALGPSYSTAQLLQKIQQATKVELTESIYKNEEKEFTIKLVTPFGKAKVCSWKANSVDAAVKEFLDANPAYRENKKGAVIAESIGDDIVREVKEEVKDGVKDLVQQDVDSKLNGEVTPADYQATYGEDIDDDSDGIFSDELANAEPEQKNEGLGPYSEVEKQLEKFKKYMYQNYRNHPGFDSERKEAIETVLDLLRELNEG